METKHFALSKLNWVGIITVLLGALTAMQQLKLSEETMGYIMVAIGILTTVLRTFFSGTTLTTNSSNEEK
jgi:cell division protein FtsW (lipid II flippase)